MKERQTPKQRIKSPIFPPFPRTESLRDRSKGGIGGIKGFTLFETLFAIFILLIAIVPMINAFGPSLFSTASEETNIVFTNYARQTLNRVAALGFKTLNNLVLNNNWNPVTINDVSGFNSLFVDPIDPFETLSFNNVSYTPTVIIADKSDGASGLLEITVTMTQVTLKTLKADY